MIPRTSRCCRQSLARPTHSTNTSLTLARRFSSSRRPQKKAPTSANAFLAPDPSGPCLLHARRSRYSVRMSLPDRWQQSHGHHHLECWLPASPCRQQHQKETNHGKECVHDHQATRQQLSLPVISQIEDHSPECRNQKKCQPNVYQPGNTDREGCVQQESSASSCQYPMQHCQPGRRFQVSEKAD